MKLLGQVRSVHIETTHFVVVALLLFIDVGLWCSPWWWDLGEKNWHFSSVFSATVWIRFFRQIQLLSYRFPISVWLSSQYDNWSDSLKFNFWHLHKVNTLLLVELLTPINCLMKDQSLTADGSLYFYFLFNKIIVGSNEILTYL